MLFWVSFSLKIDDIHACYERLCFLLFSCDKKLLMDKIFSLISGTERNLPVDLRLDPVNECHVEIF